MSKKHKKQQVNAEVPKPEDTDPTEAQPGEEVEQPVEESTEDKPEETSTEDSQEPEAKEEPSESKTYVPEHKWTVDIREDFKDGLTEKDLDELVEEYRSRDLDVNHLYCTDEQAKATKKTKYKDVQLTVA